MQKKFVGIVGLICLSFLVMFGYQASANQAPVIFQVPSTCDLPEMTSAFDVRIPGSGYVPTDWQPAEGTQLKLFLDNAGIACTYGIQSAEVGGTVMWMKDSNGLFNNQETAWKAQKYRAIDIQGIDESAAYLLPVTATGVDGMYIWEVNLLVDDMWISVAGSFIHDITEARDIISAALDVARQ